MFALVPVEHLLQAIFEGFSLIEVRIIVPVLLEIGLLPDHVFKDLVEVFLVHLLVFVRADRLGGRRIDSAVGLRLRGLRRRGARALQAAAI